MSLAGEILIPSLVAIEVETNAQVEVRHSRIYRVEVHGSIGILLWSVATGHVRDKLLAFHLLDNLVISSLWVSERVLQEARKAIITLCK